MALKNELKNLLQKYNLKLNKLLGQNFLIDHTVLEKIIGAADLSKKDTVLEVGPGLGILTEELAKRAGEVIAVEKDKKMAEIVRNVLNDKKVRNVEIIEGDILKFSIFNFQFSNKSQIPNSKLKTYKIVANIPYCLTSRLIRKFLESENPPAQIVLMVQKEVAQRICAKPPEMSLLAVSVQFYAEPKIISFVSKKSFWPRPKVDSAIIKITPRNLPPLQRGIEGDLKTITKILPNPPLPKEGTEHFFRIVHAGFSHPRKQLINNLNSDLKIDRAKIAAALKKIGLASEQRAETLSVNDWKKLTEFLTNIIDLRCR